MSSSPLLVAYSVSVSLSCTRRAEGLQREFQRHNKERQGRPQHGEPREHEPPRGERLERVIHELHGQLEEMRNQMHEIRRELERLSQRGEERRER